MDVEKPNLDTTMPKFWLEQIAYTGAEVGLHHVDLLLDQTGRPASAMPALQRINPEVPWFSLFSGTPEEPLMEQGPLLMRLDLQQWQHKAWLEDLIERAGNDSRLLLLVSPRPFEDLSSTLRALSRMSVGGQSGLLRYYDPRIFPWLIADILNPQQRKAFLQVASYWSWLDRDRRPQWQQGTCSADPQVPDTPGPVEFTDAQYDLFGCISDAQRLMTTQVTEGLGMDREQQFSQLYAWARKAAEEDYFGELEHYVARQLAQPGPAQGLKE